MKKYHLIVDFQYIYYKNFFNLKSGKLRRLSYNIDGRKVDTTFLYYCLREIEAFRKDKERFGEVTVSICFDSKSERRDEDSDYKADRPNNLQAEDFDNIERIKDTAAKIGYNVYKVEGKEADDLVYSLAKDYRDDFDYTFIYTPDKDLLVNVGPNVGVMRYKAVHHREYPVDLTNYENYLSAEFKCQVPYNAILLLLCTVGDHSDGVKGIPGFGASRFDKFITHLRESRCVFKDMHKAERVAEVLKANEQYLQTAKCPNALEAALESLELVKSRYIEGLGVPTKSDTDDRRREVYTYYGMKSLV